MREMHIYKMVSEKTIKDNIVKKTNHKYALDDIMLNTYAFLQLKQVYQIGEIWMRCLN